MFQTTNQFWDDLSVILGESSPKLRWEMTTHRRGQEAVRKQLNTAQPVQAQTLNVVSKTSSMEHLCDP